MSQLNKAGLSLDLFLFVGMVLATGYAAYRYRKERDADEKPRNPLGSSTSLRLFLFFLVSGAAFLAVLNLFDITP